MQGVQLKGSGEFIMLRHPYMSFLFTIFRN